MNGNGTRKFYGRYRGTVANNVDPKRLGRLQVVVPDVLGDESCIWAEPATPLAGSNMGIFFVPDNNTGVWVEFQQGDPNYAIWTGGWRGSTSDEPDAASTAAPTNPPIILQTRTQNQLIISSSPGEGLTLQTGAGTQGPQIVITSTSIKLSTGQGATVELTGNSVNINGTSLTISG
jgi:uncharacterized protein involved in type VI secretion and phage assembly